MPGQPRADMEWEWIQNKNWSNANAHWYKSSDDWTSWQQWNIKDGWQQWKGDGWQQWDIRDDGNRGQDSWSKSSWSDDNDELWKAKGQQTGDTYAVPGETIDPPLVDALAVLGAEEVPVKARCFPKECGQHFMEKGRTADIESMVVTTLQNGEGLDTEIYAKLEGRAFLFRRERETMDNQFQIRGWHDFGDPSPEEYTIVMRFQYVMTPDKIRHATYLAEIGEDNAGEIGDVIINEANNISVIMPFNISRILADDGERNRVPSPLVRALFGEPPIKLNSKGLTLRESGTVPDSAILPWVLYERHAGKWSAKRQTPDAYIPLSLVELTEHGSVPSRGVGQEAVSDLIMHAPPQISSNAEHAGAKDPYNFLFTPEYKQMELDTWKYYARFQDIVTRNEWKDISETAAKKMIESVYGDTDASQMVCHVCSNGTDKKPHLVLNAPKQFIEHCIGDSHFKAVKLLKRFELLK